MTTFEVLPNSRALDDGDFFLDRLPAYQSQFASRTLVSRILDGDIPAEQDPAWHEFGFSTADEYGFWCRRLCGIACMAMILGPEKNAAELTQEALHLGGYQVADESGAFVDRGWFYRPLVELARRYGYEGDVATALTHADLCQAVRDNKFVVISVHPGVIRGDLDVAPGGLRGGHLVLLVGYQVLSGQLTGFYVHNPSGRVGATQERAFVPLDRFVEAFAGRGFWVRKSA